MATLVVFLTGAQAMSAVKPHINPAKTVIKAKAPKPVVGKKPAPKPVAKAKAKPALKAKVQPKKPAVKKPAPKKLTAMLRSGTVIKMALQQEIGSQISKTGDTFYLKVLAPVKVGDKVVIQKGAKAVGHITMAKPAKGYGRSGALELVISYVPAVDGTRVPLSDVRTQSKKNDLAKAVVGTYVTGLLGGGGMKGKKITLGRGTRLDVKLPVDVGLGGARGPTVGLRGLAVSPDYGIKREKITPKVALAVCKTVVKHFGSGKPVASIKVNEKDKTKNAYADRKGNIVILGGLLKSVQSRDEMAFICGHEAAHIKLGHYKQSRKRSLLGGLIAVGGAIVGETRAGYDLGQMIFTKKSRSLEREADEEGLLAMWRSGFNPLAAISYQAREVSDVSNDSHDPYMNTHPVDGERYLNAKQTLVKNCLKKPTMLYCETILSAFVPQSER